MDQNYSTNALENSNSLAKDIYDRLSKETKLDINKVLSSNDEEKINNAYNKLLETSEIKSDEVNNEDTISEIEIPQEDTILQSEDVMVAHDPITGEQTVVESGISIQDIIDKQLDSLNKIDYKDFENLDKKTLLKKVLEYTAKSDNSNESKLADLMIRRMNGENFNPYDEFTEEMKREVDSVVAKTASLASQSRTNSNPQAIVSRMFLDQMIAEFKNSIVGETMDLDTMLSGFDKELEKSANEMAGEVGRMMLSLDEQRKAEIDAAIKRCEEQGKDEAKAKLIKMKGVIDESFTLDKFAEACKDIKIKRGDLKKPDRVFDSFNFKYEKHKNNINNIKDCKFFLSRHLPNYTNTHKLMLCLAFCKYCINFDPNDIEQHTFMYYFIRNIIAIDRLNPKGNLYETMDEPSKKFYDQFTKSLANCMDNLIERNKEVASEEY